VSHLSWRELACHDDARTPYPEKWRQTRLPALRHAFETIRHACGDRPIRVLSGYRTKTHNRRIGGARKSQHLEGRALDLRPPTGMKMRQFETIVESVITEGTTAIRGMGRYHRFIHIDVRPRPKLARWTYLEPGTVKA
jgi:uncharacterized protein YcbK (DUF882 family)